MDHIKTISTVNEQEIDAIMEIDQISNPTPWSRCSLMQYIKQEEGWSLKINQRTCAFLLFSNHIDHCDLLLIATHPHYRRRSYANELLQTLQYYCQAHHLPRILLEVRVSNRGALAFYQQMNFHRRAYRRNYYLNPLEDALILEKHVTS
jgi:ribosomal-protein-alanine acetyltransferase